MNSFLLSIFQKQMKKFTLFVLLTFLTTFLFAQQGVLQGYVLDKTTKKALPFTTVSIENTPFSTATNEAGAFYFKNVEVSSKFIFFAILH